MQDGKIQFEVVDDEEKYAKGITEIKVIGVGGGGCNAVNRMIDSNIPGIHFLAANTDVQALKRSKAEETLVLGNKLTKGLGAGGKPEVGEKAALESKEDIKSSLKGMDMVFITAGMGGGTGTGGAPVIAQIAKEMNILTVGVVTTPFELEGKRKQVFADEGLKKLRENVDSLIIIPNENLLKNMEPTTMTQAFIMADDVLRQGVLGISSLITTGCTVNIDFADVTTIMKGKGDAIMGIGTGHGQNRAVDAVTNAIYNKILNKNTDIEGATGVLLGIMASPDLTTSEFSEILQMIKSTTSEDALIIYGLDTNTALEDEVSITVIATGFSEEAGKAEVQEVKEDKTDVVSKEEWSKLNEGLSRKNDKITVPLVNRSSVKDDLDTPAIYRKLYGKNFESVRSEL